jgi:mycothiol maleylpyruvate isomerase-like protein
MLVARPSDVWIDVHQERLGLLRLLETLTRPQWETESLCSEWRVRDVVGQCTRADAMGVSFGSYSISGSQSARGRVLPTDAARRRLSTAGPFSPRQQHL